MAQRIAIGVDVGGSGIKAAAVDVDAGQFVTTRLRVVTPTPSTPAAIDDAIVRLVRRVLKDPLVRDDAAVGVGIPAVILDGVSKTATNIDQGWLDFDVRSALTAALGRRVTVLNDADAAGLAEMRFGAGRNQMGTVLILTLGTGVGSALFRDGTLVPNTEFGLMEIRGRPAERRSAAAARTRRELSWKAWANDLDEHIDRIDKLVWPNLIIVGGGVSKRAEKFLPRLTVRVPVIPATLLNDAGIVGAAMAAANAPAEGTVAAEALSREGVAATAPVATAPAECTVTADAPEPAVAAQGPAS
jgi:polyphosphate glucokinase